MTGKLPRGIWFESEKNRFRVRLYRNNVSHLNGYYSTLKEAKWGLKELKGFLEKIPKLPNRKRGVGSTAPVMPATLTGTIAAIKQRQLIDPNLLSRKK